MEVALAILLEDLLHK